MIGSIEIAGRNISEKSPPYIIAEMSANHNGSLEVAKELISCAKKAGADAVKMQTYRPDTITIDCDNEQFKISEGLWLGTTLFDLYEKAHTPWEWHKDLFQFASEIGITIFSSPFDFTAIDFLEDLNTPAYKIASFEAIDLPLIRYAASTGKPLIISTGMADEEEIEEAIEAAKSAGCKELAILHCVSGYPAPAADYNLLTMKDMMNKYGLVTGLSDHSLGNTTAIASVALGANIIEKHFTLDKKGGGPDDSFSLEPIELESLCNSIRVAWEAIGKVDYGRKSSEEGNIKFRRSLYFVQDLKQGGEITDAHVRSIRPGYGIPPKFFDQVCGKKVKRDVLRGTPVAWDLF